MKDLNLTITSKISTINLKTEVMNYQNHAVLVRYARKNEINIMDAERHFGAMLQFLYLCGTNDQVFSPSVIIDEVWHTFLLFTREYDEFCHKYFGRKIHHCPDIHISEASKRKNNVQYEKLYGKALQVFPDLDQEAWVIPLGNVGCGDCGVGGSCGGSTNCQD